jgi:adenine-specific DNA methylase
VQNIDQIITQNNFQNHSLILKVLLEDIPRHGVRLAEELRRIGSEVKRLAENDLAEFYPPAPDGSLPIAYLWARTVRCEQPECGAEIPLVRSFWLCKKPLLSQFVAQSANSLRVFPIASSPNSRS